MPIPRLLASLLLALTLGAAPALALAARPSQRAAADRPVTVYASVYGAGIFKTANLTGTWQGTGDLPSDALAVATGDPNHWRVVYAGLQDGVYASRDSGTTWTQVLRGRTVQALTVGAHNPNVVIAATDRGVMRSADGGTTWSVSSGITGSITALACAGSATVYAGGTGKVWLSGDGGVHWTVEGRGLPARAAVAALAPNALDPTTVFAATSQGLWEESGGTWKPLRHGLPGRAISDVATDAAHVFAVSKTDNAVYVSTDGGARWSRHAITGLQGGVTQLAEDRQQPGTLIAGGGDGSVWVSADSGMTWTVSSNSVAGTVGSPILALALVRRRALPVDGVSDPHTAGVQWFQGYGGHTLRGPFLAFYQSHADLLGAPLTEEFFDRDRNGARAQYFQNMELLVVGAHVVPAPLGLEAVPSTYVTPGASYTVDPHFQAFVDANGGTDLFGSPVSPAFRQTTDDGTGRLYLVQYFRNARLEYHPEAESAGKAVQIGVLGREALQAKGWL